MPAPGSTRFETIIRWGRLSFSTESPYDHQEQDMGIRVSGPDELAAKVAITEVIYRYCRGMDRMDRELTLSCWHAGGTDDHAPLYSGSAEGFVDWQWPVHAAMDVTRHVVSNLTIALERDAAGVASYWDVRLRIPHGDQCLDVRGQGGTSTALNALRRSGRSATAS